MTFAPCSRPQLETLDERLVPAVLNLTTAGAVVTAPNGAIVEQTDAQPTGTGFINSFVRIQGAASGGGSQQGFNTDGRPLSFDENKSPQFTRSLTLGQVPVVTINDAAGNPVQYREFLLDINQKSSSPYLSLDEVRVYLAGAGNLTSLSALGTPVFDLDGGGDVAVKLNARLNSGSGSGDMRLLIPNSYFAGADPNSFLYLYSKMGGLAGATANGGFEEWAVKTVPPQNATGNASISGFVFFDANQDGIIESENGEGGIGGVFVHLRGVNDLGVTVDMVVPTDDDGFYTFTGLRAGRYTIWEEQPGGYLDGTDYIGNAGGVFGEGVDGEVFAVSDQISDIFLMEDEEATGYVFTEVLNNGEE